MNDPELAAHLAEVAGKLLLQVRASALFSDKALGKAGDATANQFLVHALREARPLDGLLSEEMKDDRTRLGQSRVWIVDPVDGTREYGEGRADWAVHVGLALDGVATIGAVALPGVGIGALGSPGTCAQSRRAAAHGREPHPAREGGCCHRGAVGRRSRTHGLFRREGNGHHPGGG